MHASILSAFLAGSLASAAPEVPDAVRAWSEPIALPMYEVAPPDPNPRFASGRAYQGAQASFYPYPAYDRLADSRVTKTTTAVYLENRWIRLSIFPELGGRIFSATDKTNGYDFFYRQHVIKPALIGMLGAWISGGVEWNVPHHHRATSLLPVDWLLQEGEDGSKTVWVGETEWRHRMRWIVGVTLRPDRSFIELTIRIFNRTPLAHSFLFWTNPAVHANESYQVIFPPRTRFAVQHGKPEFARWPIADGRYAGVDYAGVDLSWWKNHPEPVSFFAWDSDEDFFGGYDHARRAGVLHVANHHVVPGKKFFEWGNGPQGALWDSLLTETDGPYLELMAGAYSDNQPDYSWIQPGEVKEFQEFWYPIRELGGAKAATVDAALNLEAGPEGAVRVAFHATGPFPGARALVTSGASVLLDRAVDIGPDRPFAAEVSVPAGTERSSLRAALVAAGGRELVAYRPEPPRSAEPMPKPVRRPGPPAAIPTAEELYLTGLRVEQLHSPAAEPEPYYEEALRRDPGDIRSNVALAIRRLKRFRYAEAEALLRTALARATENYIRPKDGEAFYYLGVASRAQGKADEARDAFWKSIWSNAWKAAGFYELAELACAEGRFAEALDLVRRSLEANARNAKALGLEASIARRLGRPREAGLAARAALEIDPLDFRAGFEALFVRGEGAERFSAELARRLRGDPQSYLEVAVDYGNAGLFDEAVEVLRRGLRAEEERSAHPMLHYYLAFYSERLGRASEASAHRTLGASMPHDYCFPFRAESEGVLRDAMARAPADSRAAYYLGNLLYERQPERAIEAWETAARLDPKFARAHRNLGIAYAQALGDLRRAVASLEKAVELDPGDPRMLYELDRLYEEANAPLELRLEALSRRPDVVAIRDDAYTRRILVCIRTGRLDEAVSMLRSRRFHNWEGRGEIRDVYVDALLERGRVRLESGDAVGALEDFQAALEYPENLEVARSRRDRREAEVRYWVGAALEARGDAEAARAEFEKSAALAEASAPEGLFAVGCALRKLGRGADAERTFERLVREGERELEAAAAVDFFDKFGDRKSERARTARARYLLGLGLRGLGRDEESRKEFERALELDASHLGARVQLSGRARPGG